VARATNAAGFGQRRMAADRRRSTREAVLSGARQVASVRQGPLGNKTGPSRYETILSRYSVPQQRIRIPGWRAARRGVLDAVASLLVEEGVGDVTVDGVMTHELSVSLNTVNTHIRRIYAELGATDRSSAVQRGREPRLLSSRRTRRLVSSAVRPVGRTCQAGSGGRGRPCPVRKGVAASRARCRPAFLRLVGCLATTANVSNFVLLPRIGPWPLVIAGMLLPAGA
jgi:hypothetical protein